MHLSLKDALKFIACKVKAWRGLNDALKFKWRTSVYSVKAKAWRGLNDALKFKRRTSVYSVESQV